MRLRIVLPSLQKYLRLSWQFLVLPVALLLGPPTIIATEEVNASLRNQKNSLKRLGRCYEKLLPKESERKKRCQFAGFVWRGFEKRIRDRGNCPVDENTIHRSSLLNRLVAVWMNDLTICSLSLTRFPNGSNVIVGTRFRWVQIPAANRAL